MYGVSLEPYFEGVFLRDLYFGTPEALRRLEAIGRYNAFLELQEDYYAHPESTARVAVISDTTDAVIPFLNGLSSENLNYDVKFNYQHPTHEFLERYKVVVLPNTNPLAGEWIEALDKWVGEGGTLIAVQDASLFSSGAGAADQQMGLGTILAVSRQNLPTTAHENPRGKGLAVYLPELLPAPEMDKLIRRHLGDSELVEVERRPAILSNIVYQSDKNRAILHLLNYRQDRQQNLRVRVRFPVARVEIFSPDALTIKRASVAPRGADWEVVVPELQTYDLVAIYAERK